MILSTIKRLLFTCVIFLLISCKQEVMEEFTISLPETTALPVAPFHPPFPFGLSNISYHDSAHYLDVLLYIPYSMDQSHQGLNAAINDLFEKELKGYRVAKEELPADVDMYPHYIIYESWLTYIERKGDIVSMCFAAQSFTWGAAHYNHHYLTLNYDLRKQKPISFNDVFELASEEEKLEFCYALYGPYGKENYEFITEAMKPEYLHQNRYFYFKNGQVVFCFGDHEDGPVGWQTEAGFSIGNVKTFIKPEYLHLLEDR